jgi:Cu-Zn family superoxide dismutase
LTNREFFTLAASTATDYDSRMKNSSLLGTLMLLFAAGLASARAPKSIKVDVSSIDSSGGGASVGSITIRARRDGLELDTHLKGLPPGEHGFHLHEKGSCAPADKDGKPTAGQAAGGHFDPAATKAHKGPGGGGHKGDLPKLVVDAKGKADLKLVATGLTLEDVTGKAIVIHEGGDNYSDTPKPLGGGGARIACGVVGPSK